MKAVLTQREAMSMVFVGMRQNCPIPIRTISVEKGRQLDQAMNSNHNTLFQGLPATSPAGNASFTAKFYNQAISAFSVTVNLPPGTHESPMKSLLVRWQNANFLLSFLI